MTVFIENKNVIFRDASVNQIVKSNILVCQYLLTRLIKTTMEFPDELYYYFVTFMSKTRGC